MLLDMSRVSLSPGCDCWSVVQGASAIVFTLTFAPVLHNVSGLTPTPLLLSSLVEVAVGWINTSVSCLVKLPLWCCNYVTLVPVVL